MLIWELALVAQALTVSVPVKGSFVVNTFDLNEHGDFFAVSVPVKGSFVVNWHI